MVPDAWWGERWCLLMERTGITDMVEALSVVVAPPLRCNERPDFAPM